MRPPHHDLVNASDLIAQGFTFEILEESPEYTRVLIKRHRQPIGTVRCYPSTESSVFARVERLDGSGTVPGVFRDRWALVAFLRQRMTTAPLYGVKARLRGFSF